MADSTKYSAGAMALLKANLGFYGTDAPAELVSYWEACWNTPTTLLLTWAFPCSPVRWRTIWIR